MVELETEVCLAAVQLYLEKPVEKRTEKHKKLVDESMKLLHQKKNQFSQKDWDLYNRAMEVLS